MRDWVSFINTTVRTITNQLPVEVATGSRLEFVLAMVVAKYLSTYINEEIATSLQSTVTEGCALTRVYCCFYCLAAYITVSNKTLPLCARYKHDVPS